MKKVLLATTALALSAGVAAAEVRLSGDARFGFQYNSAGWGGPVNNQFALEKRYSLNLDGVTTADNGVTFGARVRIRSNEGVSTRYSGAGVAPPGSMPGMFTTISGARVFARASGLEVAAGNILGAIDSMPNLYGPSVGLTGLAWAGLVTNVAGLGHVGFDWDGFDSSANGAEGVEVIYTMGDFGVHISHSDRNLLRWQGGTAPYLSNYGETSTTAIMGRATFNGWTVAVAWQGTNAPGGIGDKLIATASGKIGDFGIGLGVAQNGRGANQITKFAVNGSYTFNGATTVSAYIANQSFTPAGGTPTTFGVGVAHNLGAGARIVAGVERTNANTTRADAGVAFNF